MTVKKKTLSYLVQKHDPKKIFDHKNHDLALIKAFYSCRYDFDGFVHTGKSESFKRNAGAIQLFDKDTNIPKTLPITELHPMIRTKNSLN